MDNSSNTTARLGVFVFMMVVFGIVLLIATIIDGSPKAPIYLPLVVGPTNLAGSQAVYPAPEASQAGTSTHLEAVSFRLFSMKLYQPLSIHGIARHWV